MGYYINPQNKTKQQFLEEVGIRIDPAMALTVLEGGIAYPVCLTDNGAFMAAGIAFCKEEIEAMTRPEDRRPKWWYMVPRHRLTDYLPAKYV